MGSRHGKGWVANFEVVPVMSTKDFGDVKRDGAILSRHGLPELEVHLITSYSVPMLRFWDRQDGRGHVPILPTRGPLEFKG